jgi:PAS domain S-box-containing protein
MAEKIRVLIAEDDYLITEEIKKILGELGYLLVATAFNGVEAVELTENLKPDVVLMDLEMPKMNGLEASAKIQEICPTPIVVLTAYDSKEMIEKAADLGIGAFLNKPPDSREIERAIIIAMARFDDLIKLKKSNDELRKLTQAIEQSPTTIVITGVGGNIEYVNPKFTQLTGYTAEEALGQNPRILKSGRTPQETFEQLWRTISGGEEWHGEFINRKKNGEHFFEEASIAPVINSVGAITNYIAVKEDVTERKKVENELLSTKSILENSPVVLFRWKAAENWPVEFVSKNVTQFGYSPDDLLSGNVRFSSMIHPDDREAVFREVKEYSDSDAVFFKQEYRIVCKEGQVRWVDDRTMIERNDDGEISYYQGILLDITNRKGAEEELEDQQHLLETIINTAEDIICLKDAEGRWLIANDYDLKLFELEDVDYKGKKDSELAQYSDFYREAFLGCEETDEAAWQLGTINRDEEIIPRPDGQELIFDVVKFPLFNPDGSRDKLLVMGRDITELKKAEEELRTSEERLKSTFASMSDMIFSHDMDGVFTEYHSPPGGESLYAPPEIFLGKRFVEVLPPHVSKLVEKAIVKVQKTGLVQHLEYPLTVGENEEEGWFTAKISGRKGADGELVGYTGVVRNITERKRMEEELRRSHADLELRVQQRTVQLLNTNEDLKREIEERIQAQKETKDAYAEINQIFQTSASGLRVVDLDFNVIRANDTLAEITGTDRSKIEGVKCYDSFPGEHCEKATCSLLRIKNGELISDCEVEKQNAHGRRLPCLLTAKPFYSSNGDLIGMIEDFRDVTDKKRLESIAEAVNTMSNIGYVFSGIRHELGNPINSIKTTITVLKRKLDEFSKENIVKYVDRALGDIARVEYLLKSLKSFTAFETPKNENLHLNTFMINFLDLISDDFSAKRISIKSPALDEGLWVLADPRALHQVLLNLMVNASDALTDSSKKEIVIDIARQDKLVKFSLKDNGCGISKKEQGNLFKPFYTNKVDGTGLGMVIVKKMLAKMDGTIEVESEENVGTTVIITLPETDRNE